MKITGKFIEDVNIMKILITGGDGQLGRQIKAVIKRGYTDIGVLNDIIIKSEIKFTNSKELDVSDFSMVNNYITSFMPDIVINCAAYTNVSMCEKKYESAFKVNSLGARNLAIACEKVSSKLLHISTDYVFDGECSSPYREYDIPNPINNYGKTKLLGEQFVREFCSRYFIVRTSWLYGEYGKNFVKTIIMEGKETGNLEVVDDQIGCPTYAGDLVYHILRIILTDEYGIYHCSGNNECSWYEFAVKCLEYAGIIAKVKAIKTEELKSEAMRPLYSGMDNMMLRCTVGDYMREWQEALKTSIRRFMDE